jgi:hypothetical protein
VEALLQTRHERLPVKSACQIVPASEIQDVFVENVVYLPSPYELEDHVSHFQEVSILDLDSSAGR